MAKGSPIRSNNPLTFPFVRVGGGFARLVRPAKAEGEKRPIHPSFLFPLRTTLAPFPLTWTSASSISMSTRSAMSVIGVQVRTRPISARSCGRRFNSGSVLPLTRIYQCFPLVGCSTMAPACKLKIKQWESNQPCAVTCDLSTLQTILAIGTLP